MIYVTGDIHGNPIRFNTENFPEQKEMTKNDKDKTISYELQLPTDELFKKVHGPIVLHYTVYTEKGIIVLTDITPEGLMDEGHRAELSTYKGVMISKTNPEKIQAIRAWGKERAVKASR